MNCSERIILKHPWLSNISYGFFLTIPSLIWSVMFHGMFFCIDPLFFVFFERKFKPSVLRALKTTWAMVFSIYLLSTWNITPNSYLFYLDVVLLNSPIRVMLGIGFAIVLLGVFIFASSSQRVGRGVIRGTVLVGFALVLLKFSLSAIGHQASPVRQGLVTPLLSQLKLAAITVRGTDHVSTDVATGPTFLNFAKSHQDIPNKVVLMVVESWGESSKSMDQVRLALDAAGIAIIDSGFSVYRGSTLQGEFRELCSEYISLNGDFLLSEMKSKCAPKYFSDMGYRVFGLHGYKKDFYTRGRIWRSLGMEESFFTEEMAQLKQCNGPFPGVCDDALIDYGVNLMSGDGKTFTYMLTLSSHEPVPDEAVTPDGRYFSKIDTVTGGQIAARNAVTSLVAALDNPARPCTLAYVVGDHQPPSAAAKGLLDGTNVPYLVMSFNCAGARKSIVNRIAGSI